MLHHVLVAPKHTPTSALQGVELFQARPLWLISELLV